ncbi:MAG TPA: hypothetical protein VJ846_02070 [Sphingomicrobium sp.]|nr:hypothetical protein [Sphingomicrobium sp.]
MENDSIRASGTDTLVDVWVEGRLRAICITREAIETFEGFDGSSGISEASRCEFVRTHLPQVISAARVLLRERNPSAHEIIFAACDLGGATDRRKNERRKSDRRKLKLPTNKLPQGERRKGDRRAAERRRSPKKTAD